jgi:hypothetical protein
MEHGQLTRRTFAISLAATGAVVMLGCSKPAQSEPRAADGAAAKAAPGKATPMIVYHDPGCPCCKKWAAMAQDAGYQVEVVDHPDMPAIKARYGVPEDLRSCHTAIVGDFAFEGHVPFAHVARLLTERPEGISGLAVAGMPAGSPGMEVPSGEIEPFAVMAFGKGIAAKPFAA